MVSHSSCEEFTDFKMIGLKVIAFEAKPLVWWKHQREKIDMSPPYQRKGRIWSTSDKAYLIDSIINEYDVPKIYVADFTFGLTGLSDGEHSYAIIDGKQRFEAIFDFFDGEITLDEEFVFKEDPTLKLGGLGYKDLKRRYPRIAERFDTYSFSVMRVLANSVEPINELFIRLNRSKSLTGAEMRNAMSGPAPGVIREIAKHEFFTDYIKFKTDRGQDHNTAAKILLFEYEDDLHETKKKRLDRFVDEAATQSKSRLELASRRVLENLDRMIEIFLPRDRMLSSAGILPVYYWFIREHDMDYMTGFREFLVDFEAKRLENRKQVKLHGEKAAISRDLLDYDRFNRSTNDQVSHAGRYDILNLRYHTWQKEHEA